LLNKIAPQTFERQNQYLSFTVLANIAFLLVCIYLIPQMPERIPLWYGAASGESQLGSNTMLSIVPAASILFLAVNQAIIVLRKEPYTSALLLGSSALFLLMCLISTARIGTLVGPW